MLARTWNWINSKHLGLLPGLFIVFFYKDINLKLKERMQSSRERNSKILTLLAPCAGPFCYLEEL